MIARTPYDALPAGLLAEFDEACLGSHAIYAAIVAALAEDLPGGGDDVTSAATISPDARGTADFASRETGVVAGLGVAAMVFQQPSSPLVHRRHCLPSAITPMVISGLNTNSIIRSFQNLIISISHPFFNIFHMLIFDKNFSITCTILNHLIKFTILKISIFNLSF